MQNSQEGLFKDLDSTGVHTKEQESPHQNRGCRRKQENAYGKSSQINTIKQRASEQYTNQACEYDFFILTQNQPYRDEANDEKENESR